MFPWWERDVEQQTQPAGTSYHLRTRRSNGAVGLLVDPGAHDNLIGSITAAQMCQGLNIPMKTKAMNRPLPVEGVVKNAQIAEHSACIPMALQSALGEDIDASYTAPMISESMLPPLLGNKTLSRMGVVLDCGSGKLIVPGPGGIEVKMSPGSHVFELEFTSSGHWVLPVQARSQSHVQKSPAAKDELSFAMSCRRDRSSSPKRSMSPARQPGGEARSSN